jgi:DNA-directed RNA polymerase specialized sigma24 family protein
MTTGQVPGVDEPRSAPTVPCPCGRGDVAMEMERERPLLERAIAGDTAAFAELYAENVDDVYRYLLAWTGDEASARELTEQVFRNALTWLPVIAGGEGDLAAWLLISARDAVVQHRGSGWVAAAERSDEPAPDVLVAFNQLDDAQREVVVLRLLLGHSLAHTAHLAGYSTRVVGELQLAACTGIWERLSGAPVEVPPPGPQDQRARWFERSLEGAYLDPTGDPGLQDVLAVADALRQAAPRQVPLPDDAFVQRLRQQLIGEMGGQVAAVRRPRDKRSPDNRLASAFALVRYHVGRHPWAATVVAAAAIGLIFGIQIANSTGTRSACGNGPCLASTTESTVAEQAGIGVPTVSSAPGLDATTLLSTTTAPPTTLPQTTRPPTTAPATAPPTTAPALTTTTRKAPGPPSSHGRPTTTAAPTTTEAPPTTAQGSTTTAGLTP